MKENTESTRKKKGKGSNLPSNVITVWNTNNSFSDSYTSRVHLEAKASEEVVVKDTVFHAIPTSAIGHSELLVQMLRI